MIVTSWPYLGPSCEHNWLAFLRGMVRVRQQGYSNFKRYFELLEFRWYCDKVQAAIVNNLNSDTYEDTPFVSLLGICENIKNYLDRNSGRSNVWPNSMLLTYKPGSKSNMGTNTNRADACKDKKKECTKLKKSLWPKNNQPPRALTMSYDVFPFNASEEGGTGAEVACVPEAQQRYQAKINSQFSGITDNNNIGTLGGSFDTSAYNNLSVNPGTGMMHVLGGVNLQGNPK
ncbi:CAZyme family GH18 [Penicillium maclennaniae]|uniref:CAZyme family GH18 n=1 Tax=Penicillium maclennaniae TaxID=1343394 RepID=UPI0025418AB5|nr:CAZyme family GH18 [Penicillium maclennaniae]KAJ5674353.1 CAZyme family GH18 [Penicillium maclennaniae]